MKLEVSEEWILSVLSLTKGSAKIKGKGGSYNDQKN